MKSATPLHIYIYYLYSLYCALFHIFFLLFQYGILYNQQPWGLYTPDKKNIRTISKTPFILKPKHWQTYHWYVQKWRKWYPNFWQFSCQWWESDFLGYHGISWDTLFSDKAGTKEFTPVRLSKVDESNRSNTMEIVWNRARMNGYASNKIDHFIWSFWSDQWLFPQINEWQVLNQDMVHQATCVSLNISDLIITQFFTTVLAQNTSYKY